MSLEVEPTNLAGSDDARGATEEVRASPTPPENQGQIVRPPLRPLPLGRNDQGLTARQKHAVQALLQEPTITRAATLVGVNEKTLRRWMHEPAFQKAYHDARREAFGQSIGLMQRYSPVAVQTLVQVMTDPRTQPPARVAAAAVLLRFGREGIELDDLALRIEALEQGAESFVRNLDNRRRQ